MYLLVTACTCASTARIAVAATKLGVGWLARAFVVRQACSRVDTTPSGNVVVVARRWELGPAVSPSQLSAQLLAPSETREKGRVGTPVTDTSYCG